MGNYGDRFNAAVAAELRGQRAKVRITVDGLAQGTGYAKSTVLNYLNGKRDIPLSALGELCRVLGTSPRAIFESAEKALDDE